VPTFRSSDGLEIAHYGWGEPGSQPPVVLQHGFIGDARGNWELPGIVGALVAAGRQVVAPDARGHGASAKPHDPAFYGEARMARDVIELADHLGLDGFDLAGYSMGAVVSLIVGSTGNRVRRLAVGGVGEGGRLGGVDTSVTPRGSIAAALRAEDPETITDPAVRAFRMFADATGGDRLALAAQADSMHSEPIDLAAITAPTLVLAGDADTVAARPERLAAAIPGATLMIVPGDHLGAVGAAEFRAALACFFI
jgi:pimeloyl-ACP methyl ester carboxylesterase